jgi:hypothetical protein
VAIHFSAFAPLFTVLVAKYVFNIFQYCLETMLTTIVTMDRVLLLLLLSSLSLLAAAAVFVMLRSVGLLPFNPGCHSGSPCAKGFHFIKPLSFNVIKLSTKIYDQSFLSAS